MRLLCLAVMLILCGSRFSLAQLKDQNPQSLAEPSADAYSLGKYGFQPPDKYTGSANFSLPIHTIKFGELSLPITLSYSQSGLRVAEDASLVGLGWSLTSSGVITRKVNDADDFLVGDGQQKGWINCPDLGLYHNSDPLYL